VKLMSFQVATPMGTEVRIGAVGAGGEVVDLASAYRIRLLQQGVTARAAARISRAVLPGNMVDFIEGGGLSLQAARESLEWALDSGEEEGPDGERIMYGEGRFTRLPTVPFPPMLRDFMAFETHLLNIYPRLGQEIPPEWYDLPVYYKGNTASLAAHGDDIPVPPYAEELDFEFELAAVIGSGGTDIPREEALRHVFGYTIYNDFSERKIQKREMSVGLGPAKGKDFLRGHVLGPWLVTADEVSDVYDLRMVARVNGDVWCDSSSGTMHWKFEDLISHASMGECVRPGEVFGSGTVGNGSGAERDTFLQRGDVVELEVDGLGTLRNRVV
jgi:2-keto-4-pentenoate hydratase/2-oxohepta-3-ene-1,7-dioic acid hydratase in catechol pathway